MEDRKVLDVIKLEVIKVVGDYCDGCFFLTKKKDCSIAYGIVGSCSHYTREDGCSVIFREVKEEK